ncbi:MAG TPA: DNA polymerase III subunit gamma/tau [Phycisphaerae bacterium]|nr:DNA polymerase III subunit gamma/tau [Phycisphaerae bacterium]
MAYTVLARRYRPKKFDEVIGQEPIARTLASAIATGRVAHAYLFCGTRGVGKTTMARILAEALNCEKGPTAEPCGTCDICQAIHRGEDVDVLEIDGASNTGVDDVRTLRENAYYRPARARYKIYYIDEVHMLSRNAFNALLKVLEEPPEHVLFLFSTTEPERLPATILSRCQRFDFRAVPTERIAEHLANICKQEKVKADAEALLAIAREGRGSVRDALTLLDQAIAMGGGKVTIDAVRDSVGAVSGDQMLALLSACADGDAGGALRKFSDLLAGGADVLALLDQCIRLVRDLLVVKTCGSDVELVDVFGPDPKALAAEAKKLSVPALVAAMGYLVEARSRARWAADGRPVAELAVVRLASLAEMEPLPEVLARLDRLQQSLSGGSARPLDPDHVGTRGRPEPVEGRPAPQPTAGEKKKHDLSENEGRVPGEAEEPGAEPPDQRAEGQEGPSLPPREPAKRRKLDEAMMDPLIQKAIRLFDGRIVNIED